MAHFRQATCAGWGEHLIEYANKEEQEEEALTPYTVEELLERAEEGRRQIAMGNYCTMEELLQDLDEDFAEDNKLCTCKQAK